MALVVEGARDTAALRPPALGVGHSAAWEARGRGRGRARVPAPWRLGRAAGPACLHGLAGLLTSVFCFLMDGFILIGRPSPDSIVVASDLHARERSLLNTSPPWPCGLSGSTCSAVLGGTSNSRGCGCLRGSTHVPVASSPAAPRLVQPAREAALHVCVSSAALCGHRVAGAASLDPCVCVFMCDVCLSF